MSRVQARFIGLEPLLSVLTYVLMITLQGPDLAVAPAEGANPSGGRGGRCQGGNIKGTLYLIAALRM